ncbi:Monocarboxylate transporter 14 [Eumeta japonica]|uniref:Monocarboxylate transporter 14 n=1 Tax=Eumeta variegata TaxID=151549 RepID=A0A4C1WZ91_EUMVA|nr:Monocarboxylate transporter 14 [Eumeta japonica]
MEIDEKERQMTITENIFNDGVKFADLAGLDSICSSDNEGEADNKPDIPDGGWGWVVVLSSFIISMIADGISFSFGLLYIEFLDEFGASKSTTAWIGSLFIAVPLLSGPVMSALVDRYGCRSMTILGGLISTLGFVLAAVSTTLEMMMLTFGVIAGLGLGLVYVTAVVSIAYWFDKKRNLAVGLGACGTGVGTFIYAPMTQFFIEEYGWRGAILLLSGTLLNLCVCGTVMRDPEWWILEQKRQSKQNRSRNSSSVSISGKSGGGESIYPGIEELRQLMKSGEPPDYILTQLAASIKKAENLESTTKLNANLKSKGNSLVQLPTFLKQREKVPIEVLENLISNKRLYNIILVNYPSLLNNFRSSSEQKLPTELAEDNFPQPIVSVRLKAMARERSIEKDAEVEATEALLHTNTIEKIVKPAVLKKQDSKIERREWLKKQFSVNYHYLKDLRMPKTSIMHRNAMLNISKYRLKASSCPNIYKNSMITLNEKEEKWYDDIFSCLSGLCDATLFLDWHFLLLCSGTVLLFIWFIVPYFYLAEHMIHRNYSEDDGAVVLSLIGITNTIGMVGLGWIGDRPWVNIGGLYAACLLLCGACVAAMPPAAINYWVLAAVSAAFGLLFAGAFTFTPSLLVELVPLEQFTSAYGLVLLVQGIGHLIGPPLSGLIFDMTNSWELSFYLAGGWIAVAGSLILMIPFTKNFKIGGERRTSLDVDSLA